MEASALNLKIIVLIFTVGLAYAAILGYLCHRAKLSPILGYLLAGYLIGPYSPGFVADAKIADQLAEIGVILMMFGVGLHFKWSDLIGTKNIAIPGAIGQTFVATLAGALLTHLLGWPIQAGVIFGFAVGVASTVVAVRVLAENKLLHQPQGHIAIGWLIVEDVITVIMLLLLSSLADSLDGEQFSFKDIVMLFTIMLLKIAALIAFMFTIARKFVAYAFEKISKTKSHELFTLTILALTFVIAAGASVIFGVSIALGAFIAGMLIGLTNVHRKVELNAMPMRDAFVVLFFISVGMIFDPSIITREFTLFICILAIILVVKPLTAFAITIALKQPFKTALVVALTLAQIGEFSFILAEESMKLNILPDDGYDIIVACAIISIAVNPFLLPLANFLQNRKQKNLNINCSYKQEKLRNKNDNNQS